MNILLCLLVVMLFGSMGLWAKSSDPLIQPGWNSDSAITFWENALRSASDTDRVIALNTLCWKLRRRDVHRSLDYGRQALELARSIEYPLGEAKALNFMGVVYRNVADYGRAMELFFQARAVAEKHGIITELAYAHNNIAGVYLQRGSFSQAEQALGVSRQMFTQTQDSLGLAYCDLMAGDLAQAQQGFDTAIAHYTRALQTWRALGDVNQISVCCVSIAQVYRAQHKYSLALATLNQALLILDDQPMLAAGVDNGMAETFFEMREYRRAIEYAELGVQIAQKSNAAETVAKGAQILARSYAMLGDFEQAYDYQQLYATTAALLRNNEVQEKVAAAEANYKAAKQETKLIALNKDREQTALRLIATAIGFVFLVLVVLLLVRTLAAQRRANAEITRQQQILEEQATQIELSNAQLQEKNLALDSVNAALVENNQQLELYVKMLSDANSKVQHQISVQQQQALQLQIVNAQLEEKNDQVEHAMRQLKATEAQLVQSERTNAMGMLTAGVMHEINNPNAAVYAATGSLQRKLNAIRTYFLSLIDEADRTAPAIQELLKLIDEGERAVAVAREGAERVKAIVARLQHFTKHQREGFGCGRIAEELSSTIELFRFQFKNVVVHTNLDDGTNHTLEIEADFGELNQVFLNFLVNAAQAGATVIRIDVERATLPSGKAALCVCLRDNGAGMSAEVQHNIFEPFFTTKGAGNTGLGLSISKNVIDRHKGTIDVHSELGKGTTFAVTLPLKHEA